MFYAGVNFWAVIVATIAAMAFGAAWYGALAKPWMAATGLSPGDLCGPDGKPKGGPTPYIVALIAKAVMAFCFARLLALLDAVSVGNGVALALFVWIAFVATTLSVNHRFGMKPWALTFIDGGYWLGVLMLMGIVTGLIGGM